MGEFNVLEVANFLRDMSQRKKARKFLEGNPAQLQSMQGIQGVPAEVLNNPYARDAINQALTTLGQGANLGLTTAQTEAIPAATRMAGERTEAEIFNNLPSTLWMLSSGFPQEDQTAITAEALKGFSPEGPAGRVASAVGRGMKSAGAGSTALGNAILDELRGTPAQGGMLSTDIPPKGTNPPQGVLVGQPQGQGPAKGYQFPNLTPPPAPQTFPSGNLRPPPSFNIGPEGRVSAPGSVFEQRPSGPMTEQQLLDLIAQGEQVKGQYQTPGFEGTIDYIMELLGFGKEQRAKTRAAEEEALRQAEKARSLLEVTRQQKR